MIVWLEYIPLLVGLFALAMGIGAAIRRHRTLAWSSLAIALGNAVLGLTLTVGGLISSFSEVASADPSQKASRLAEGISLSMHATAWGLGTLAVSLPVAILAIVRSWLAQIPADEPVDSSAGTAR